MCGYAFCPCFEPSYKRAAQSRAQASSRFPITYSHVHHERTANCNQQSATINRRAGRLKTGSQAA
eukprot:scaffold3163_cov134-Skeletonema_menzelii.AAC.7